MARLTEHSKQRIVERIHEVKSVSEAKKLAKQARISGHTVNHYQTCPQFYNYLYHKCGQTNTCTLRVYKGYIFIWRGKSKSLVTVHSIPERFIIDLGGKIYD